MITPTEKVRALRAEILACPDADPILSYEFIAADADVSLATFKRSILPHLEIIEITDNRRGARRSSWEAFKTARVRKPKAA
jgi:hypothetical protein